MEIKEFFATDWRSMMSKTELAEVRRLNKLCPLDRAKEGFEKWEEEGEFKDELKWNLWAKAYKDYKQEEEIIDFSTDQDVDENGRYEIDFSNFRDFIFPYDVIFKDMTFTNDAYFQGATFIQKANFGESAFKKQAKFNSAIFMQKADFWSSTFTQKADFTQAKFKRNPDFWGVVFKLDVIFSKAIFSQKADFSGVTFEQKVDFTGVIFTQKADFAEVTFTQAVNFRDAEFNKGAKFREVKFQEAANFRGVVFIKDANFRGVICKQKSDFWGVTFNQSAYFAEAIFKQDADFEKVVFKKNADFSAATFKKKGNFLKGIFRGAANFKFMMAKSFMNFENACFLDEVSFRNAIIKGNIRLHDVGFGSLCCIDQSHLDDEMKQFIKGYNLNDIVMTVPDFIGLQIPVTPDLGYTNIEHHLEIKDTQASAKFRKLKKMAAQSHNHTKELKYFRKELIYKPQTSDAKKHAKFLIWLYETFARCGTSGARPAVWLFIIFMPLFALLYILLSNGVSLANIDFATVCIFLKFSFHQAVPFLSLGGGEAEAVVNELYGGYDTIPDGVGVLSGFHRAISLTLEFLIGLGIRNYYRM